MTRTFKVEIRDNCKVCGGELPNARFRTYCGEKCRKASYNNKNAEKMAEWQRVRIEKLKTNK